MNTSICPMCYAVLPGDERAMAWHEQWHDNIASVAIETTKRIDDLTHRLQELEAGYR
jgi:hypothetical protein